MSSAEVIVQFVGRKISQVVWRKETSRSSPEIFALGSFEESVRNSVDIYQRGENHSLNAIQLCSYPISQNVTDLK